MLFTDPLTRIGGEKYSYQIPTYEALKGILSSVYWKPTIVWFIDKVRVIKPIRTQPRSAKPVNYRGIYPSMRNPLKKKEEPFNDLSIYTYLVDVEYQVPARLEWNENRPDLVDNRNEHKHYWVAQRIIRTAAGGMYFSADARAMLDRADFGEGVGFYSDYPGEMSFGLMFHGWITPTKARLASSGRGSGNLRWIRA